MTGLAEQPVDMAHLDRYTGGNRDINMEVFRLFEGQCREMVEQLQALAETSTDGKLWHQVTHTLKGAARGIGAFSLGNAAASAEEAGLSDRELAIAAVQQIRTHCAEVMGFIDSFLNNEA